MDAIPAKYRKAFTPAVAADVASLRLPVKLPPRPGQAGSLLIPAWTFDRGNLEIYASPDKYANSEPMVGSDSKHADASVAEYDIDFPAAGDSFLLLPCDPEALPGLFQLWSQNAQRFCILFLRLLR